MAKIKLEIKNINIEDEVEYVRAGGECICEKCGKKYIQHPLHERYDWLNVLCNGKLVKL